MRSPQAGALQSTRACVCLCLASDVPLETTQPLSTSRFLIRMIERNVIKKYYFLLFPVAVLLLPQALSYVRWVSPTNVVLRSQTSEEIVT